MLVRHIFCLGPYSAPASVSMPDLYEGVLSYHSTQNALDLTAVGNLCQLLFLQYYALDIDIYIVWPYQCFWWEIAGYIDIILDSLKSTGTYIRQTYCLLLIKVMVPQLLTVPYSARIAVWRQQTHAKFDISMSLHNIRVDCVNHIEYPRHLQYPPWLKIRINSYDVLRPFYITLTKGYNPSSIWVKGPDSRDYCLSTGVGNVYQTATDDTQITFPCIG